MPNSKNAAASVKPKPKPKPKPNPGKIIYDEFVNKVNHPQEKRLKIIISGYVGKAPEDDAIRVYSDATLTNYCEFLLKDILHAERISGNNHISGGSIFWVDAKANISFGDDNFHYDPHKNLYQGTGAHNYVQVIGPITRDPKNCPASLIGPITRDPKNCPPRTSDFNSVTSITRDIRACAGGPITQDYRRCPPPPPTSDMYDYMRDDSDAYNPAGPITRDVRTCGHQMVGPKTQDRYNCP